MGKRASFLTLNYLRQCSHIEKHTLKMVQLSSFVRHGSNKHARFVKCSNIAFWDIVQQLRESSGSEATGM